MMVGRNEPCPCGSGKKYKRCCGEGAADPLEIAASRIRDVQNDVEPRVLRFVRETLGDDAIGRAWAAFVGAFDTIEFDGPGRIRGRSGQWMLINKRESVPWIPEQIPAPNRARDRSITHHR